MAVDTSVSVPQMRTLGFDSPPWQFPRISNQVLVSLSAFWIALPLLSNSSLDKAGVIQMSTVDLPSVLSFPSITGRMIVSAGSV